MSMYPCEDLRPEREALDAVKGVLILAVVLGHSLIANSLVPTLKGAVYSFHVQCFLLLPFLLPASALTPAGAANLLVRYLVPYLCAVVFFSVLRVVVVQDVGLWTWLSHLLAALATGNAGRLKEATGFYLFWFLPALTVLVLLRAVYFRQGHLARFALGVLAVAAHVILPALPWPWKRDWPMFGTHIALFMFPLGLCIHLVARPLLTWLSGGARLLLPLCFAGSLGLLLERGMQVNLVNLGYSSYRHPPILIHQDLVAVLALLSLLAFSRELARVPSLSAIGNKSLPIYLLHQSFIVGTVRILGPETAEGIAPVYTGLVGGLSVLCGVIGPLLVARLIYTRVRLRSVLFPRSARDLLYGFGVLAQPPATGAIRA